MTGKELSPNNTSTDKLFSPERKTVRPRLTFVLSSKTGLGHASRAIAILNYLCPENDVTIRSDPTIRPFLIETLQSKCTFEDFYYAASLTKPDLFNEQQFISSNRHWLEEMDGRDVLVCDFPLEILAIRHFFDQNRSPGESPIILGIYHSIEPMEPNEVDVESNNQLVTWQRQARQVLNATDVSVIINPINRHVPMLTESGSLLIPADLIVRPLTKTPTETKQELGLKPEERYIALAGGMKGKRELDEMLIILNKIAESYGRKLVYLQFNDSSYTGPFPSNTLVIRQFPDGQNILAGADFVIAKPGMQTLSECLAYQVPLIFVSDDHPERQIKIMMLAKITNREIQDCVLLPGDDIGKKVESQLKLALSPDKPSNTYPNYSNGTSMVAEIIRSFFAEIEKPDFEPNQQQPLTRGKVVAGKSGELLSFIDSARRAAVLTQEVMAKIIEPLTDKKINFSAFAFGGIAKGKLRLTSDADILLVVHDAQKELILQELSILLGNKYNTLHAFSFLTGAIETLRINTQSSDGTPINISLMSHSSYRGIFSPFKPYFREQPTPSNNPNYYVTDYQGHDLTIPKYSHAMRDGAMVNERQSPSVMFVDKTPILGVKQRMLLIQEPLHDGLCVGNPTSKLLRGITRAICYWNNLYKFDDFGEVVGLKPEAFNSNFFFRMLRDPTDMLSTTKYRQLRNLFFNELRRIDYLHRFFIHPQNT